MTCLYLSFCVSFLELTYFGNYIQLGVMKKLTLILSITILSAVTSFAGPSWGFTLGNGAGFSWNQRPIIMPVQPRYRCQPNTLMFQSPQYYRVQGVPPGTRIRNYTDAPLVITRQGCSREIIPRSWD